MFEKCISSFQTQRVEIKAAAENEVSCENVQPIHGLEKDEKRIFQTENKVGVRYWIK